METMENLLLNTIIKDNKTINDFQFNVDSMSRVFEWYNGNFTIYATPYWDGSQKLPINISNSEGDEIDFQSFDLIELKNITDVNSIIEFYFERINEITKSLMVK